MKTKAIALSLVVVSTLFNACNRPRDSGEVQRLREEVERLKSGQQSPSGASEAATVSPTPEARTTRDHATIDELKTLQPQVKRLANLTRTYINALNNLVNASQLIVKGSQALGQSQEASKMYSYDPNGAQQILNQAIEKHYDNFQRLVRNELEAAEDGDLPREVERISKLVAARPNSSVKTILQDALKKCRKAQKSVENYHYRQRTNLDDKWNQIASVPNDLGEQITDLEAEANLLEATDEATSKQ